MKTAFRDRKLLLFSSVFTHLVVDRPEFLKCLVLLYITEMRIFCSFDVVGGSTQNGSKKEKLGGAYLSKENRHSCVSMKECRETTVGFAPQS